MRTSAATVATFYFCACTATAQDWASRYPDRSAIDSNAAALLSDFPKKSTEDSLSELEKRVRFRDELRDYPGLKLEPFNRRVLKFCRDLIKFERKILRARARGDMSRETFDEWNEKFLDDWSECRIRNLKNGKVSKGAMYDNYTAAYELLDEKKPDAESAVTACEQDIHCRSSAGI